MGILYSNLKIFHFKEKLDSLPPEGDNILPPIHVRIKPTNLCCHNCKYCAYGKSNLEQFSKDEVKRVSIPRDKMMEIADDIIKIGVKAVTFSGGGEPLVYPYLIEAVKRLAGAGVKLSTLTNGALLKGEIARLFALHGTWIRISMDGWDDESYSYYRGAPNGEYSKIIKNIEDFKNFGGNCYLGVSLIIDEHNATRVHEMLSNLKRIGVNSVKLSPCLISDRIEANNDYHKPFFSVVRAQTEKAVEGLVDRSFEVFDAYRALDEKFEKDYSWCPYIQILPIIGADLNVYACPDKAYNLQTGVVGSIKDKSFKEFWFSDRNNFFRINPARDCNHHCERNQKNKLVLDYLNVDRGHLEFM